MISNSLTILGFFHWYSCESKINLSFSFRLSVIYSIPIFFFLSVDFPIPAAPCNTHLYFIPCIIYLFIYSFYKECEDSSVDCPTPATTTTKEPPSTTTNAPSTTTNPPIPPSTTAKPLGKYNNPKYNNPSRIVLCRGVGGWVYDFNRLFWIYGDSMYCCIGMPQCNLFKETDNG